MYEKLDKLIRMLTQEKKLGFENKAIFGGLEKLAPNWANEALEVADSEADRQFVREIEEDLRRYPGNF
jgi:hypothetical protein